MTASMASPASGAVRRLILTAWLLQLAARASEGSAVLQLQMMTYDNSVSRKWDGSCCSFLCWAKCDHFFKFGLDLSTRDDTSQNYYYWSYTTGTFEDQNTNTFLSNMEGVANPIVTIFTPSWPGAAKFKVYVQNNGGFFFGVCHVDTIVQLLQLTPAASDLTSSWSSINMRGMRPSMKSSLTMQYRLYCQPNYYSTNCSVYCLASDSSSGHYTCDPATGSPVCRSGWRDPSTMCTKSSDNCIGNSCQNGSTCVNGVDSYTCTCAPGFTGAYCNININECASNPCLNGGTCVDLVAAYRCTCPPAYLGSTCSQPYCQAVNPCLNGATCYGAGLCQCTTGYIGSDCSINRCQRVACSNGGTCFNGTCVCPAAFTGTSCDIIQCTGAFYCLNGGTCFNGTCTCSAGFTGQHCEINVNECASNPCLNGGTCVDLVAAYRCTCPPAYLGSTCSQPYCQAVNPCLNGATCYGAGLCQCPGRFYGPTCSVDRCDVLPCENGGNCTADGTCDCPSGFIGKTCEISRCSIMCCQNGGRCDGDKCDCAPGFTGANCETNIDDCVGDPCQNNGTCDDHVDGFTCRCLPDWTGSTCSKPVQAAPTPMNMTSLYIPDEPSSSINPIVAWFYASFCIIFVLLIVIIALVVCLCRTRRDRLEVVVPVKPHATKLRMETAENDYVEKPTRTKTEVDDEVFVDSVVMSSSRTDVDDDDDDDPTYQTIGENQPPSPPPRYSTIEGSHP